MSRRNMLTIVELTLVTAALTMVVWLLGSDVTTPDRPQWVPAGLAAAITCLALAAVATIIAIGYAVRLTVPRMAGRHRARLRRRLRILLRRIRRLRRSRPAVGQHAGRIGGTR